MTSDPVFRPVSGIVLPCLAGIPAFMRPPHVAPGHDRRAEVDVGRVPCNSNTPSRLRRHRLPRPSIRVEWLPVMARTRPA